MKILTNKLVFGAALKNVSRAVSSKSSYPVLSGIKFTADEVVTLTGSDLELTIVCTVPAQIVEPGSLILPVRVAELIDKLPSGAFTIESQDGTSGLIKYGDSEAVINGFKADEYPEMPVVDDKVTFEISGEELKDAISRVINLAADQNSNAVLCGVAFEVSGNTLTLAATDTHRLGYAEIDLGMAPGDIKTVIPKKALFEVLRLLKPDKNTVIIGSSVATFKTDNMSTTTRTLMGTYPDYRKVIPVDRKAMVKINTQQLRDSVERASLINSNGTPVVNLKATGEKLVVSQRNECGHLCEEIKVDTQGEDFEMNFNAKYLAEMLRFTPAENTQLSYTGRLTPMVLVPGDQKGIALLLPIAAKAS